MTKLIENAGATMELRRIRYFLAVAEELHFGRAAERLHMAQPPLSEQIRKLEEELGARLFERGTRGVALTQAGRAFLAGVRRGMVEIDGAAHAARQLHRGLSGKLVFGFVSSASLTIVPQMIGVLKQQFPGIEPELRQYSSGPLIADDLLAKVLDIGLLRPPVQSPNLKAEVVLRDEIIAALPLAHRLSRKKTIGIEDLKAEGFILFPPHSANPVGLAVQQACAEAGFQPQPAHYAGDLYAMLGLVAAGLGVALVPASMTRLQIEGICFIPVRRLAARLPLALAWRANEENSMVINAITSMRRHMKHKPRRDSTTAT